MKNHLRFIFQQKFEISDDFNQFSLLLFRRRVDSEIIIFLFRGGFSMEQRQLLIMNRTITSPNFAVVCATNILTPLPVCSFG